MSAGQTFASFEVFTDCLVLIPKASDSATALVALDALIEDVLANSAADWALAGVDAPSIVTLGAVECLGTLVHLSKQTKLGA